MHATEITNEDWGTTPAAIRNCLDVGDSTDVQVGLGYKIYRTFRVLNAF